MPEGHTLHRLAGALDHAFAGTTPTVTSPQGRFADGAALLTGRPLESAEAYGKHLFVRFAGDAVLNVHLGLIGSFDVLPYADPAGPPAPVGAVRVRLVNDSAYADLRGATTVQLVTPAEMAATIARLGPDPLRAGTAGNEPERSLARLARTTRPVAECLMDQTIIAGVGNLYRCEVLFRHRVDPFVPGAKVKKRTWLTIWDDLIELMRLGVAFGQILTLQDQVIEAKTILGERDPTAYDPGWAGLMPGERGDFVRGRTGGHFPRDFAVYQRDGLPCLVCGSRIRTRVLAGRNLFWCGRCQRRH
ncbi:MAG: DNA-formamidopyrimidine glycosylase family protein [Tetrasphaera sp.]